MSPASSAAGAPPAGERLGAPRPCAAPCVGVDSKVSPFSSARCLRRASFMASSSGQALVLESLAAPKTLLEAEQLGIVAGREGRAAAAQVAEEARPLAEEARPPPSAPSSGDFAVENPPPPAPPSLSKFSPSSARDLRLVRSAASSEEAILVRNNWTFSPVQLHKERFVERAQVLAINE